ncbi:hypothetical protein QJS10_CPB04g00984 [Acorus calamus]|uniref:Uncharacterized protein n=1 Tax=Acorus calamus TaxID=4465 RepID=A0AAV9EWB6_ACOCL|nr:hypothetical protein QJS10_CPB04g00984 [Acorus calamus]
MGREASYFINITCVSEWIPTTSEFTEVGVKFKQKEIILNWLSSEEEATHLFNQLGMEVP